VRWSQEPEALVSRLNEVLIDRYADGEPAGYPTLCKGRFMVNGKRFHALEEPTSLNTLDVIPQLAAIGVAAVKIEGRQRSPSYVEQVTDVWRQALDRYAHSPSGYAVDESWNRMLDKLSEGSQTTLGAYHRPWQ
jgi:putative protease